MAIPTALHPPIGGLERCTRPTIVRVVVIHVGLRRPRVRLFPDPERSLGARVFSSAPRHLANRSRASSWGSRAGRPLRDSQLTAGASGTGLFARRQRASMSAYFTNSLTRPARLGLLPSLRGGAFPGRAARGPVAPRKMACRPTAGERISLRFKAINSRTGEGQPGRCPFLIGSGNGRQDAQPCSTCRSVALLRRCRLDLGLFCFGLDLLGARWSRRYRDSLGPLGLTWAR